MADYDVGYGKPPKQFQFKPGHSGNRKGRPKRAPAMVLEVLRTSLGASVQYRERGRTKTTTRTELGLKKILQKAVAGDLKAAAALLEFRNQASRHGRVGVETIEVINSLETYFDHPAEQSPERSCKDGPANESEGPATQKPLDK